MKSVLAGSVFFALQLVAGNCLASETQTSGPAEAFTTGAGNAGWSALNPGNLFPQQASGSVNDTALQTNTLTFYDFDFAIPEDARCSASRLPLHATGLHRPEPRPPISRSGCRA